MEETSLDSSQQLASNPRSWTAVAVVATVILYWPILVFLCETWVSNTDYSHGFFVPLFAGYLVWSRREALVRGYEQAGSLSGFVPGLALVVLALAMRVAGIYTRTLTVEAVSMIPFLLGLGCLIWGSQSLRSLLPGTLFLLFMFPIPASLAGQLSGTLQTIATKVSTFGLQTLGIPAVAEGEGNVITLTNGQIGVAEACSGIRMLFAFFALTVGACLIIDRSPVEKILIAISAIPIAIAANCIRILVTGLAYEYLDAELAHKIFHDVAGWLMMPLGFLILIGGLALLERIIVPADSQQLATKA